MTYYSGRAHVLRLLLLILHLLLLRVFCYASKCALLMLGYALTRDGSAEDVASKKTEEVPMAKYD